MSKVTKTQLSLFAVSYFICVLMLNTIIECQFETMSKNVIWWLSLKLEYLILNLLPILQLVQHNVVLFRD